MGMFDQEIPEYVSGPQRIRRAGQGLADQLAPGIKRMTGYESPKRKAMAIAAKADLNSMKSIQDTYQQIQQINPTAASAWMKDVMPQAQEQGKRQVASSGGKGLSNLGEHFRDAMSIKQCAPGDEKCKQEAMDLMFKFKKPESAVMQGLGKGATTRLWDGMSKAEKARSSMVAIDSAVDEIEKGIIAGSFSGFRQDVSNLLYTMGVTKDPSILNTKKFIADTGKLVLNILGSGDLGAGTGLSDKDVEFAKTVAGASTDIPPEALIRILDMNRRASQRVIERHNAFSGSIAPERFRESGLEGIDLKIKLPKARKRNTTPGVDPAGSVSYGEFTVKGSE